MICYSFKHSDNTFLFFSRAPCPCFCAVATLATIPAKKRDAAHHFDCRRIRLAPHPKRRLCKDCCKVRSAITYYLEKNSVTKTAAYVAIKITQQCHPPRIDHGGQLPSGWFLQNCTSGNPVFHSRYKNRGPEFFARRF